MKSRNILSAPFEIYGLAEKEENKLWRVPESIIDNVNDRVSRQGRWTCGVCVRFRTDANAFKITAESCLPRPMEKADMISGHGVDVYFDNVFAGSVYPKTPDLAVFEGEISAPWYLGEARPRDVRLELPISDGIKHMEISLPDGALLSAPTPFTVKKQVVFYGSSITMGLYGSRPGTAYIPILSRALDFAPYNLGFGSGAHGELIMADYIASLPMSVFVLDYDHNDDAPELWERHEPFFRRVRGKRPDLPIVIMTRPDIEKRPGNLECREAVRTTYLNALKEGDRRVYFVDGGGIYGNGDRGAYTIDGVHPNDMGMYAMAQAVMPALRKALIDAGENVK